MVCTTSLKNASNSNFSYKTKPCPATYYRRWYIIYFDIKFYLGSNNFGIPVSDLKDWCAYVTQIAAPNPNLWFNFQIAWAVLEVDECSLRHYVEIYDVNLKIKIDSLWLMKMMILWQEDCSSFSEVTNPH